MSTAVEQRIVEMKFDRKGFSEGVQDTLKDLDKLDEGMRLDGGRKGLAQLQRSIDNVQFQTIMSGIESVQGAITATATLGQRVFDRIMNQTADWITTKVRSLSVDQIAGGFSEYELKMDSVRTIMSSTGKDIDTVNDYLEQLNEYSDKTIYSFSDMTASIGKFTNAGVDLDKAVMAIKGISSEAALSGANAQQASAAMYNFAQALSSGSVKLIDWKSIENANMATKEFKQELLNTAVAMGTVVEHEGRYLTQTASAAGKTDEAFDAVMNFNDSLKDEWMTSDVLVETLSRYADENSDIGSRAMAAAQEVTSYTKMMDALKEQVGSGWSQTFEILFGNLEEAKVLWTSINEVIGGFIQGVSDTRNGILQMWKAAGGHKNIMRGLKNIWFIIENIAKYIGLALETITGHRYLQNFERVTKFFADKDGFSGNIVVIQRISDLLIGISDKFNRLTRKLAREFNPRMLKSRHFLEEIYQCAQAIIIPGRFIAKIVTGLATKFLPIIFKLLAGGLRLAVHLISKIGYALTEGGLQQRLYDLADLIVNGIGGAFDFLYNGLVGFGTSIAKLLGFKDIDSMLNSLSETIGKVVHDGIEFAIGIIDNLIGVIKNLGEALVPVFDAVQKKLEKIVTSVKEYWSSNEEFTKLKESIKGFFKSFSKESKPATDGANNFKKSMDALIAIGYDFDTAFVVARKTKKPIEGIGDLFGYLGSQIQIFYAKIRNSEPMKIFLEVLENLKTVISQNSVVKSVGDFFKPLTDTLGTLFDTDTLLSRLGSIGTAFSTFFDSLTKIDASSLKTTFEGIGSAIWKLLGDLKELAQLEFDGFLSRISDLWNKLFGKEGGEKPVVPDKENGLFSSLKTTVMAGLNGIIEGITNFNWNSIGNILQALISIFIVKKIVGFFNKTKSISDSVHDTLAGISDVVSNFADATEMSKWQIAADAFKTFSEAVLELVSAVVILSIIPEDALTKALGALFIIALVAVAVMWIKEKFLSAEEEAEEAEDEAITLASIGKNIADSIKEFGQNLIDGITSALSKAALGILIVAIGLTLTMLVGLLERLKDLSWGEFLNSLGKLALVMVALLGTLALLEVISRFIGQHATDYIGMAIILLGIAGSIKNMVKTIQLLAEIPWETFMDGYKKMALTILAMIGAMLLLQLVDALIPGQLTKISMGLLGIAIALTIMMVPVLILAAIPIDALKKALTAVVVLVASIGALALALGGAVRLAGGFMQLAGAILMIVGIAGGLMIFGLAIQIIVSQAEEIKKYAGVLIGLAVAFVVFAAAIGVVGYVFGGGILALGAGFALIGAGLLFIALAVDIFADASIKFANSMDTIVGAVSGREKEVVGAISAITYGAVKGIMDGLVYALAALLAGLDDALLVLDAKAFSIGEHLTTVVLKVLAGIVVGLIKGIGKALGFIGKWLSDGLLHIMDRDPADYEGQAAAAGEMLYDANAKHVVPSAAKSAEAVNDAYDSGLRYNYQTGTWERFATEQSAAIDSNTEKVKETARHAGYEVKESFGESMNDPGEGAGSKMMGRAAREIESNTPAVKEAASTAGEEIADSLDPTDDVSMDFEALKTQFPDQFGDLQSLIDENGSLDFSSLYSGIGTGVEEGGEEATAANDQVIQDLMNQYQGADWSSIGESGQTDIAAALQEYSNLPVDEAGSVSDDMIEEYINANYGSAGEYSDQELADGIDSGTPIVRKASIGVSQEGATAAGNQRVFWESTGAGLVQGLANAINDKSYLVENASSGMMTRSINAMEKAADEHSPSKETYRIGWFLIKGLVNAIVDKGHTFTDASGNMVDDMLGSMQSSMSQAFDFFDKNMTYSPVISPVVDSRGIQYGINNMQGLFSASRYSANVGASLMVDQVNVGSAVGDLSTATMQGNSDLLSELRRQNDELTRLNKNLENQRLYLDSGAVVGGVISKIDSALGQRAILAGRRG